MSVNRASRPNRSRRTQVAFRAALCVALFGATLVVAVRTQAEPSGAQGGPQGVTYPPPPGRSALAAADAVTLPPNFSVEKIVDVVNVVTDFAFAPDGRVYFGGKDGHIYSYADDALTVFADLSAEVNAFADRGVMGLALDPKFPARPYVFVYYSYDPPGAPKDGGGGRVAQVARLTADPQNLGAEVPGARIIVLGKNSTLDAIGDVGDGHNEALGSCAGNTYSPVYIEDCISADAFSHNGGGIGFGPDGAMFVALGDTGSWYQADNRSVVRVPDLRSLTGKLLRVDAETGLGLPDNPFYNGNPASNRSRIYNYGYRNPFRMTIINGEPYAADVGSSYWEEINVGRGLNFGWPCYEGDNSGASVQVDFYWGDPYTGPACRNLVNGGQYTVTAPFFAYPHPYGASIGIGPYYTATVYPEAYRDKLFVFDYEKGWIKQLDLATRTLSDFGTGFDGIVAMVNSPEGVAHALQLNYEAGTTSLLRFNYGANAPPVARIGVSQRGTGVPQVVGFDGSKSSDPDGAIASYVWDFGDGTSATGRRVSKVYTEAGAYTVRLAVADNLGYRNRAATTVYVGRVKPVVSVHAPISGTYAAVGSMLPISATALDYEDGDVTASVEWNMLLHHNDHVHYDFFHHAGAEGVLPIPDHGDEHVWFELCATARDSDDLTGKRCANLYPNAVLMQDGFEARDDGRWQFSAHQTVPATQGSETVLRSQGTGANWNAEFARTTYALGEGMSAGFDFAVDSGNTSAHFMLESGSGATYSRLGFIATNGGLAVQIVENNAYLTLQPLAPALASGVWHHASLTVDRDGIHIEVRRRDNGALVARYTRSMPADRLWRFHHWILAGTAWMDNYSEQHAGPGDTFGHAGEGWSASPYQTVPFDDAGEKTVKSTGAAPTWDSSFYRPAATLHDGDTATIDFKLDAAAVGAHFILETLDEFTASRWGAVSGGGAMGTQVVQNGNWMPMEAFTQPLVPGDWYRIALSIHDASDFVMQVWRRNTGELIGSYHRRMPAGKTWRFRHVIYAGTAWMDNYREWRALP